MQQCVQQCCTNYALMLGLLRQFFSVAYKASLTRPFGGGANPPWPEDLLIFGKRLPVPLGQLRTSNPTCVSYPVPKIAQAYCKVAPLQNLVEGDADIWIGNARIIRNR
eukprot:10662-Pelagomonas_calceolata.AAC.3